MTAYRFFVTAFELLLEVAPYLLIGFLVAGLLKTILKTDFVSQHLGGNGIRSILKAVLTGIPLPVCSCGVIPIAATLRRQGASKAAVLAFLYSTPVTGVDSILATYALMGLSFAIFRSVAALIGGIFIGLLVLLFTGQYSTIRRDTGMSGKKLSLWEGFRYGFLELPADIGKWIIIGILAGAAISTIVPEGFISRYLSNPYLSYPMMLLFSIPLYVCATGSIPIAVALIWKGLTPGAALAFLIAGPATNTVTITFILKEFKKKMFFIYIAGILVTSVVSGVIFDLFFKDSVRSVGEFAERGLTFEIKVISAFILLLIIGFATLRKEEVKHVGDVRFRVPDMNCEGCVRSIKSTLLAIEGIKNVSIDLKTKEVFVESEIDDKTIAKAIASAGYTVQKIKD